MTEQQFKNALKLMGAQEVFWTDRILQFKTQHKKCSVHFLLSEPEKIEFYESLTMKTIFVFEGPSLKALEKIAKHMEENYAKE